MDISGVDSAQLPLALAIGSLVNGASWQSGPVGPNTILTLFYRSPPGVQSLQVLIDGQGAEILYSGPTQLNFVIPPTAIPKASALLQISSSGNLLVATPLQIVDASPALFTVNQSGTGQASVLNQDYTRNGTAAPAARGSTVMVYGTGFGVAKPLGQDGLSWLAGAVSATIGGLPAEVTFAGRAPGFTSGLQQINIRIPTTARPAQECRYAYSSAGTALSWGLPSPSNSSSAARVIGAGDGRIVTSQEVSRPGFERDLPP